MVLNDDKKYATIEVPEENIQDVGFSESEPYLSPRRAKARAKAIERGFASEYEFDGWLYFNRIDSAQYEGYSVDVLHMLSSGDSFE